MTPNIADLSLNDLRKVAALEGFYELAYDGRTNATRTWGNVRDGLWHISYLSEPYEGHVGEWFEWEWWDGRRCIWRQAHCESDCWRGVLAQRDTVTTLAVLGDRS